MDRPRIQTWTLFVCLGWMFVGQAAAEPQYLVAVPGVLEAGTEAKYCLSLLQPDEPLVITITLVSTGVETILLNTSSPVEFHQCYVFQVPMVKNFEEMDFKVKVEGSKFFTEEVGRVMIRDFGQMTFIQTDKPIYLPGQTVHFRVFTLDSMFRPANGLYNTIEIMDLDQNRVGQWLNATSDGKILQLSYSLNSEAREGDWRVYVNTGKHRTDQYFKVKKYVLPKFDVEINTLGKHLISIGQEEIKVEVCAKYTYGQSVPGSVKFQACRHPIPHNRLNATTDPCYKETKKTEKSGCTMFNFKMSTFRELLPEALPDSLDIHAEVEEEGTSIIRQQWKKMWISDVIGKLFFIDTPRFYDRGSIVEGKVKVVNFNNEPIPHMLVYFFPGGRAIPPQNLTTDSHGIASFTLNTSNFQSDIHLRASPDGFPEPRQNQKGPRYERTGHVIKSSQTPSPDIRSSSSLEVKTKEKQLSCDTEVNFPISYNFVGDTQGAVDVMYLVLSRGNIVMQGHQKVKVHNESVTNGQISFTLKVTPDLTPQIQVVAYASLPNKILIAHSAEFATEKCFNSKVSLAFSSLSSVPGEATTLQVSANPGSLCGVSAVDQSVFIEEPEKTLDAEKMFRYLPNKKRFFRHIHDTGSCLELRYRRSAYRQRGGSSKGFGGEVFQRLGLKIVTNMFTRMPSCVKFMGRTFYERLRCYGIAEGSYPEPYITSEPLPIMTSRAFFPETWIWRLVEVGESGSTNLSFTVPDTITTWETKAFCLSPQGFGLASQETHTVFQPFFLELSLPYSIIRGEQFDLKATVFNYLTRCIMVTVTPAAPSDYTLTPLLGEEHTTCLCANERKTFRWTMNPSVLGVVNVTVSAEAVASHLSCDNEIVSVPERGRIDVVTRTLIVKAEGKEMTKTYNWLLCPKGETLTEEVELQLPDNVIDGSARASLSVLGDMLGRALNNLDGLLKMPYGCGEQNMVLLAPNIYILEYLKNTQQLTSTIKEKGANFLTSGYQRQLNYKHYNGAYSAFGTGDGNTWLTAFVLRSFVKARTFVFIDPYNTAESRVWLESKQQENGCFQQLGKLFNNRMKGGVSDEVTLSAYVTAAFLEMNTSEIQPAVQRSLSCLKESLDNLGNTYTTALLAYVFTLAGDMETRALLLRHLDTVAIQEGNLLHWSQNETETSAPLSVEISSYVLLAKLSASPTAEDLAYSTRIARWLTGQQNKYGGFSSTQDTVVALQALSLYSTRVFSPEGSSTVTAQSTSGKLKFNVNPNNRLLYQEEALKDMTGKYRLEVKGTACVSMQISLHYNIPISPPPSTLRVEAELNANCTSKSRSIMLRLKSLHYGNENTTNMVMLEIRLLSGYVPDPESLRMIKLSEQVDRVENSGDHVQVYLRELIKDTVVSHVLRLTQALPVQNLKPAVVKIYDYYQPSYGAEIEYTDPCAAA
ncbi:alpha-2-macroglobulin-like [Cheilinus undulatus]|uniref:alpha-2-macroglobulin-like n=1 Tax=Cheilinus undulatus TaxID=241271 RepID=UPI001BD28A67|nr:alpha-2-macroglobulin-like [Cheilinus undulatus]